MPNQTFDTVQLTDVINKCVAYSLDGRISDPNQQKFLGAARRLRGDLVALLTLEFDAGTQAYNDATTQLQTVITVLNGRTQAINNIANTVSEVTKLVKATDKLLDLGLAIAAH